MGLWRLLATFPFLPFLPSLARSSPLFAVFGVRRSLCCLQTLAALAASLLKFHRRPTQAAILKSCKAAAPYPPFIQFFLVVKHLRRRKREGILYLKHLP